MKKLLLTLGLAALAVAGVDAQGIINPINGALTRIRVDSDGDGIITTSDRLVTAADGLKLGVFWGAAGGPADTLVGEMVIREAFPGILDGLPFQLPIAGAGDAGTIISLRIAATGEGWQGSTPVKQVKLANPTEPGTIIWNSRGTTVAGSETFRPEDLYLIPEPSTLALMALGGFALLCSAQRRFCSSRVYFGRQCAGVGRWFYRAEDFRRGMVRRTRRRRTVEAGRNVVLLRGSSGGWAARSLARLTFRSAGVLCSLTLLRFPDVRNGLVLLWRCIRNPGCP